MEKSLTKGRMGGRLVRLGMTALLMALPATAFPVPSKGGVDAPEQVIQKDEPQKPKRKITGQLLDEQGEPLIGASVAVKGTSERAVTDLDGNYTIMTGEDAPTLVFSYMGYATKEVTVPQESMVNGQWSKINAVLSEDTAQLEEVVVTALGIKREKKMLGYAVQDLKSEQLNVTGDPSVTSALSGKIAGVEMNTASTGLGGSTKITIRGNSSLTDNNQPLWVVDGVPFSDNQSSDVTAYGGYDRGGTIFDLNPEDIESISVLKGPNAAALYGARAGNGVILVTTKKGAKKDGWGISYSGSFTWSQPAQTIKLQDKYGQGSKGEVSYTRDEDDNIIGMKGENSYGPLLDGHPDYSWNGQIIPYQAYGNKLTDYFKTGFSHFHTASLGKQTESSHFRLSFGFNDNHGMFKDERLNKMTIDLNAGQQINRWLNVDGKVSLSRTKADNRPQTGLGGEVGQLLLIPANVRLEDLAHYSTPLRPHQNWHGPNQQYSNPYYIRHQMQNSDERLRAFGYFAANLDFKSWLKFQAKYAFDYYRTRIQETNLGLADQAITTGDDTWQSKLTEDNMYRGETNHFEHNISAMFLGDYTLNEDWRLGYTLGGNIMYQKYELLGASVQNLLRKDTWLFNTAERLNSATDAGSDRAMYSIFASAQVAFKEYLSLDLTARNDWSSTLPASNRSFFYPSASLSYIFSDFMSSIDKPLPRWITFSKLRLSWAQVGKDPDPYNLYNTQSYTFSNGIRQSNVQTIKMNSDLKPEIKSSYEIGLDMKFLQNRLGFDFTYYYNSTRNQAMLVDASSPWSQQWVNAGKVNNKGIEFTLYTTPVKTRDFTFDLNLNLAHNVSTVAELADGVDRIYFNGDSHMPVRVGAVTGGKLGDIYAKKLMKRDEAGNVIVNANGLPQPETGDGNQEQWLLDHPIGNIQPKVLMSVIPSFSYKGITLSAMFDMKFGGDIVSVSEGMATLVGTSERTLDRGEFKTIGGIADWYLTVPGMKADGTPNDIPVSAETYYQAIGLFSSDQGYAEEFVHDASYIKLKELSIGYDFPKKFFRKTPLTSLRLSFVARNLCFLMKNAPGNPEGGYDTTMFSQALDFLAVPYARTYGFTVNLGF
ncbi:MAG: SusC/RagA family TonB-linked outer membrane protein [Bacteroidaceae bacterium]|nr:SusC/RagA family TonB-linked outer membrane protein [Bacteroidaceae bacterium]